jgi:hypothetical protein
MLAQLAINLTRHIIVLEMFAQYLIAEFAVESINAQAV